MFKKSNKKGEKREEFLIPDIPVIYDTKYLSKNYDFETLIDIISDQNDYINNTKKQFSKLKKLYDEVVGSEEFWHNKCKTIEEESFQIKEMYNNTQQVLVRQNDELEILKKPTTFNTDDILKQIHTVVCRIIEDPNGYESGDVAEQYQKVMGNTESNLKGLLTQVQNSKIMIKDMQDQLTKFDAERTQLHKKCLSQESDVTSLENIIENLTLNVSKLETVNREISEKNSQVVNQMREMKTQSDANTSGIQVDYDTQIAQTKKVKEDQKSSQNDQYKVKFELEESLMNLNLKNQEIEERKKLTTKLKIDMKDVYKKYKQVSKNAESIFYEKQQVENKLEEMEKLVSKYKIDEFSHSDELGKKRSDSIVKDNDDYNVLTDQKGGQVDDRTNCDSKRLELQIELEELKAQKQDLESTLKDKNEKNVYLENEIGIYQKKVKELQTKRENALSEIKFLKTQNSFTKSDSMYENSDNNTPYKGSMLLASSSKKIERSSRKIERSTSNKKSVEKGSEIDVYYDSPSKKNSVDLDRSIEYDSKKGTLSFVKKANTAKKNEENSHQFIYIINPDKLKVFTKDLDLELRTVYHNFLNYSTSNNVGDMVVVERQLNNSMQIVRDFSIYVDDKLEHLNLK